MYRLFIVFLLGVGLVACSDNKQAAPPSTKDAAAINLPSTSIVEATVREVSPAFEFPAVVEAVQLARVRPEITATVKAIHFSPGDMVEKGELLLEFDDATYRAEYEVAEANLQSAEAAMLEAGESWERAEGLLPKGYISQQDYDKARAAHDSALAARKHFDRIENSQ